MDALRPHAPVILRSAFVLLSLAALLAAAQDAVWLWQTHAVWQGGVIAPSPEPPSWLRTALGVGGLLGLFGAGLLVVLLLARRLDGRRALLVGAFLAWHALSLVLFVIVPLLTPGRREAPTTADMVRTNALAALSLGLLASAAARSAVPWALAGAALLAGRALALGRASDEYVRASGDPALVATALAWPVAAATLGMLALLCFAAAFATGAPARDVPPARPAATQG